MQSDGGILPFDKQEENPAKRIWLNELRFIVSSHNFLGTFNKTSSALSVTTTNQTKEFSVFIRRRCD